MGIEIREVGCYKEFEIVLDGTDIGYASIKFPDMTLENFNIYPQHRGKGYGTEAVRLFVEKHGVTNLWVAPNNDVARHIYEKNGFVVDSQPLFVAMRVRENIQ